MGRTLNKRKLIFKPW